MYELSSICSTNSSYILQIDREKFEIERIDGFLMIKKLIDWYKEKVEQAKEDSKKQLLMETIKLVENYK